MNLKIQIMTLSYSFLYGAFFSILLTINYKLIYNSKRSIKLPITMLFILINVFLYFLILKKINNGIIHPYCLISFALGFIVKEFTVKLVANYKKK